MISLFDSRLVMGINVWIKPIKFAASITIYVWTIAWLLEYLCLPNWANRIIQLGNLDFYADRNRVHCHAGDQRNDIALQRENFI